MVSAILFIYIYTDVYRNPSESLLSLHNILCTSMSFIIGGQAHMVLVHSGLPYPSGYVMSAPEDACILTHSQPSIRQISYSTLGKHSQFWSRFSKFPPFGFKVCSLHKTMTCSTLVSQTISRGILWSSINNLCNKKAKWAFQLLTIPMYQTHQGTSQSWHTNSSKSCKIKSSCSKDEETWTQPYLLKSFHKLLFLTSGSMKATDVILTEAFYKSFPHITWYQFCLDIMSTKWSKAFQPYLLQPSHPTILHISHHWWYLLYGTNNKNGGQHYI